MSEPEGDEDPTVRSKLRSDLSNGRELMNLDIDLDASWPFDSNPSSPFIFSFLCASPSQNPNRPQLPFSSSDEQPSSPLWLFSDAAEAEKPADSPLCGGFRQPDAAATVYPTPDSCKFSLLISCVFFNPSPFFLLRFSRIMAKFGSFDVLLLLPCSDVSFVVRSMRYGFRISNFGYDAVSFLLYLNCLIFV